MSEAKLISPLLDNFDMGGPISEHDGVCCYPAMRKDSDDRYIVKKISIPASQTKLDALLLTGAYPNEVSALAYFKELAEGIENECRVLQQLSQLEGFLPFEGYQVSMMEDRVGYHVHLLSTYRRTLRKQFQRNPFTHLQAVNLGLDICAALAVCRRSGYLFVNLKPNNIYVVNEKEYRIGDLGFVKLDSLKFTSLPDMYRSQYTAPELADVMASLNSTIDIYAAGLILYQAYNGGKLPFEGNYAPSEVLPAPEYADYEISEIILKACSPNPEDRWQDPIEMGQALVSYMQRNDVNDTPIVPISIPIAEETIPEEIGEIQEIIASDALNLDDVFTDEELAGILAANDIVEDEIVEEAFEKSTEDYIQENTELPVTETEAYDDDLGNLDFLKDLIDDETAPENNISDLPYEDVSEELSDILSQADELVSHPVPDPVVAPDPIDVPVPEPIILESEEVDSQEPEVDLADEISAAVAVAADNEDDDSLLEEDDTLDRQNDVSEDEEDEDYALDPPAKKKNGWLITILIILMVAILAVGGYMYYQFFYLQPVTGLRVEGDESNMIVYVDSAADESLLSVVCSDFHGNQIPAPVVNGQATFANLHDNTAYTVKVIISGFHRLTGETSASYTTPAKTNIVEFVAISGSEDGSVMLRFTVDGPDSGQWSVVYSADGEEERTQEIVSHTVELYGLTVGKEYTFRLVPNTEMYVAGTDEIKFTASKLVFAENLKILSCIDNQLTVAWDSPEDTTVSSWTVRCYNNSGYDETITTAETTVVFDGLDCSTGYNVDVTAEGMSVTERTSITDSAITITDFQADTSNATELKLSWNSSVGVPDGGWILLYTVDGSSVQNSLSTEQNSATISPMIPGASYQFILMDANGSDVLTTPLSCDIPDAVDFSGYGTTRESVNAQLCKTPEEEDWDRFDLEDSDYTTSFASGDKVSILFKLSERYTVSDDNITTLFVFRDQDGRVIEYAEINQAWKDMWYQFYCEMDIPYVPVSAGEYTLDIYFDGTFVTNLTITIQ